MRKNYLFFAFAMLCICTSMHAQITVTNSTFPAVGDTLYYAFDTNPNVLVFTPPGGNQTWDFSSLKPSFAQQQIFKSPTTGIANADFPGATLLYLNGTVENYLQVTDQEIRALGYYGKDPIGIGFTAAIRYNPPLVERRSPIQFFDIKAVSSGVFFPFGLDIVPEDILRRFPARPDSLRIRIAISRTDVVDGYGNLIIPDGTYPVLREKRTQYTETRLDAKVSPLGWLDVTDVAIQAVGLSNLGVDTTVTYHFFNDTSKEPIAVVTLNQDQATPRLVQYKSNRLTTDVKELASESPQILAFPNPASDRVTLRFNHMKPGRYFLKICNVLGTEVGREVYEIPEKQFETILNVSRLQAGTYFYNLIDNQGHTSPSNQLMIVK